ncbi:hypothetical protein B0H16DRAFT_1700193 [Mycena metata]|uniref:Uncharacterized protein n=1 Tax=Mycena metata TaxID=1033252 RepID=A0AAD7MJS2_9AGAR|nr:hypothetical protein B0H16DRAFT_1700193 [Mycena metata]
MSLGYPNLLTEQTTHPFGAFFEDYFGISVSCGAAVGPPPVVWSSLTPESALLREGNPIFPSSTNRRHKLLQPTLRTHKSLANALSTSSGRPRHPLLLALVFSLLTYIHTLKNARTLLVANTPGLRDACRRLCSVRQSDRIPRPAAFAFFPFLLWIAFGLHIVPGYITYKHRTLNLEAKVNQQWSQELGATGRLTIQSVLGCCGYFSPSVEATVSATWLQEKALTRWYIVSFGLVPADIGRERTVLAVSRSDFHVRARAPWNRGVVRGVGCQLADQYGADAAAHIIANNSGNTGLRAQMHTRGSGLSGLSGLRNGSGGGGGSGGYTRPSGRSGLGSGLYPIQSLVPRPVPVPRSRVPSSSYHLLFTSFLPPSFNPPGLRSREE